MFIAGIITAASVPLADWLTARGGITIFLVFAVLIYPGILLTGYGLSYKNPPRAINATEAASQREAGDFEWTYTEEPHATRRKLILEAHPEIKNLFGYHPHSKFYCAATVFLQVALALYCSLPTTPLWQFILLGYVIGGTCSSSLTLAIHEMSHHLFFKSPTANMWFGFFANGPMVIPYTVSFKMYHLEHHRYQGVDGIDTDIPTALECHFFTTPFRKFLWVLLQPCFYAMRPTLTNPKPFPVKAYYNVAALVLFNAPLLYVGGPWAIYYLIFSTFFGLGLHPMASHFIAEHYTNMSSQRGDHMTGLSAIKKGGEDRGEKLYPDETFSYRGFLNNFAYNVGYHVAHHDFPFVSGLRLKEVERLAPEFYEHLPSTYSWWTTIPEFVLGSGNGFDRVKRQGAVDKSKAD